MTSDLTPRSICRGRPRTSGSFTCDPCGRKAGKHRASWPEGRICGTCFTAAMRTHGTCPGCASDRMLPGRAAAFGDRPVCVSCAGITADYHCTRCGTESEHYRKGICARCSLRDDLTFLLRSGQSKDSAAPETAAALLDALCAAGRPESIHTWLRDTAVRDLLGRIAAGDLPLTHKALDDEPAGNRTEHLRSLLIHHGLLPPRDHSLAGFEQWLTTKFNAITDQDIRRPVEQFARWHHLRRIRSISREGRPTRGPVHNAKQEITETLKFLTWLGATHGRTLAQCVQADVDAWLADGPTTRHAIRTFFVWAVNNRTCTGVTIGHRQAKTLPMITQEQRLGWLRECLTSSIDTAAYRIAAALLLLYAQPVVKIAQLRISDVILTPTGPCISFGGTDPVPLPEPFAGLLKQHLISRPNLQTGNNADSPWLFPGSRPGRHLSAQTLVHRLNDLGINLRAARNTALRSLVAEAPPPLVAEMLGYSYQVTQRHAAAAAEPWSRYPDTERFVH